LRENAVLIYEYFNVAKKEADILGNTKKNIDLRHEL